MPSQSRCCVAISPASGSCAWKSALLHTLSPGDRVLMYETGHFAALWKGLAERLGLVPEFIAGDWRSGADPAAIGERLAADKSHTIKAVCVVHNETSTGCTSRIAEVRKEIDRSEERRVGKEGVSTCKTRRATDQ